MSDIDTEVKNRPPEERIALLMRGRGFTLAAAESCTGGLILHRLTNVPGSSEYVMGGFVVYSNQVKVKYAHVSEDTLQQHGAVSEQTAIEMARGTRQAFGTTLAVSVTGIAGPGGGTETKPVGLTYIGISTPEGEQVMRYVWEGSREANKTQSAEAAMRLILDYLVGR